MFQIYNATNHCTVGNIKCIVNFLLIVENIYDVRGNTRMYEQTEFVVHPMILDDSCIVAL